MNANVSANENAFADIYVATVAHVKNKCECNVDVEIHVDVSVNVDVYVNENLNVNLSVHVHGHFNMTTHVTGNVHVHVRQHLMAGMSSLGALQAPAVRSLGCSRVERECVVGHVIQNSLPLVCSASLGAPRCLQGPLADEQWCSIQALDGLLKVRAGTRRNGCETKENTRKDSKHVFRVEITHLNTQVCQHLGQFLRFLNMKEDQVLCRNSNM